MSILKKSDVLFIKKKEKKYLYKLVFKNINILLYNINHSSHSE